MAYVIQRTTDGKYVSRPGSLHSYALKLQAARLYETRNEAARDLCVGNERILTLEEAAKEGQP